MGALCYPNCDEGYYGVGPVCWEKCSSGAIDDGITCRVPLHIYGKGCCCIISNCCNICNAGYIDDGCTCRRPDNIILKKTKTRGAGTSLVCDSNEEYDSGLCYKSCAPGFYGIGPVCWKKCSTALPYDCGAICTLNKEKCVEATFSMVFGSIAVPGGIALMTVIPTIPVGGILIETGMEFLKNGFLLSC